MSFGVIQAKQCLDRNLQQLGCLQREGKAGFEPTAFDRIDRLARHLQKVSKGLLGKATLATDCRQDGQYTHLRIAMNQTMTFAPANRAIGANEGIGITREAVAKTLQIVDAAHAATPETPSVQF